MEIYVILNKINYKAYFGLTCKNPLVRWRQHKSKRNTRNQHLYQAMRKYGIENFSFHVVDSCVNVDDLHKLEQFYIKEYNTFGRDGYNMTMGGDGLAGYKFSDEHRRKLSEATKLSMTPKRRKQISQDNKNRYVSKLTKDKMSESRTGFVMNDETYAKHLLRCTSECKPICQYDMNNKFIKTHKNSKVAAKESGTHRSNIMKVCRYKRKHAGGFIWRYADDPLTKI